MYIRMYYTLRICYLDFFVSQVHNKLTILTSAKYKVIVLLNEQPWVIRRNFF